MKKILFSILFAITLINVTGCVGVVAVGAATTVYAVTDPRSSKELLTDNDISLQAQALGNKPPLQFNVRVNATTFRGDVLLMGQAINQEYKDRLTTEVGKIKGVKNIYNQMKVKPLLSLSEVSNDVWITTKVKSALLGKEELKSAKISVYTEDSEVFLVGLVTEQQADFAVDIARNISGVTKVIKAFYHGENKPVPENKTDVKNQQVPTEELSSDDISYIQPIEEETFTEQDL